MLNCSQCHCDQIRRSKRRGGFERKVLAVFFVKPFRCERCAHRFFRVPFAELPGAFRPAGKASSAGAAPPQS